MKITRLTPYEHPSLPVVAELTAADLTDSEIAFCWRHVNGIAVSHELPPIAYDNGIEPDAALRVAL